MRRGFSVLDFETTGLAPKRGDRVIEIGAVYMDPALNIDGGLETLINPQRDVGPTRIHGVTARDVFDAPTFDLVAPELFKLLDGRVIVGHNIAFDLRFLTAEMEREGYEVPEFVAVDTMQIAKSLLKQDPPPSFKLHDITRHLGFGIADVMKHAGLDSRPEHSALGDAMVTAYLLGQLHEMSAGAAFWATHLDRAEALQWPEYVPVEATAKRRGEAVQPAPAPQQSAPAQESVSIGAVLQALGAKTPAPAATAEYARLLETSLEDRILDANEIDALVTTARNLGLDSATLGSLHRGQFDEIVREAWADGVVTEAERADIVMMAQLLGIDNDSLQAALKEVPQAEPQHQAVTVRTLEVGALIVLTGDMSMPRNLIEEEILALGFAVGNGVTKKTALVVAADPFTQSGKAKKARDYGIEVLGVEEGLALIRGSRA